MAVTQVQFERALQERLSNAGFDLTKKDTQELLDLIAAQVRESLKVEMKEAKADSRTPTVVVRGLGRFKVNSRPAGWGRNPGTGEKIRVKASKRMKVLADKNMRDALKVK